MDLNNKKATFWVTASLLGSSIEPIIVKFCYQLGYLSSQLIALKLIFGCLIFIPFYKNILAMKFNHVARSMVIALLAIITNYSVFLAVEEIDVNIVVTLISTTPVFVGLVQYFSGKVDLKWTFWPSVLLVLLGIMLSIDLSLESMKVTPYGLFFISVSVIGSLLYRISVEDICTEVSAFNVSTFIFIINGIVACFFLPLIPTPNINIIPYVAWIGIAGSIANIGFVYAIKILGATQTSVLSLLQRPFVIILSAIVFHELITPFQFAGMCFVLVGVFFARTNKKKTIELIKEFS